MSKINSKIGAFKVQAYQKGEFKSVSDADLKGKWSVVFFYPADFTFVCPTELGDMADLYPKFKELGCEIYSVSTDTHFVHKAWADASKTIAKVQFPMLGDPTGAEDDSHSMGLLEYPHYTKPANFRGWEVPDILVSGDHAKIDEWRREQALIRTLNKRPDMLEKAELSEKDKKFIDGIKSDSHQ